MMAKPERTVITAAVGTVIKPVAKNNPETIRRDEGRSVEERSVDCERIRSIAAERILIRTIFVLNAFDAVAAVAHLKMRFPREV